MTFLFYSVHESSNIFICDYFVNFLSEFSYFDFVNYFLFELNSSLQMFDRHSLLMSSSSLLNCIFNFRESSAAWVLLEEFNQWHCQIHKLLYKVHEIIYVDFDVWDHTKKLRHAQMLHVSCNLLLVHFFSAVLLLQNLQNNV